VFVSAMSPAMEAEYAVASGQPITPHSEAMITTLSVPRPTVVHRAVLSPKTGVPAN
jgi:hypothetical protein